MDRIDKRIIEELRCDGRLPIVELARRVALSPTACQRRVKRLEIDGVIEGYTIALNSEKCGLLVEAFVGIRLEKPNEETMGTFERNVRRFDEVYECFLISGEYDYLLRVKARDLRAYEEFVRTELAQIPEIARIETMFAFGAVKAQRQFQRKQ